MKHYFKITLLLILILTLTSCTSKTVTSETTTTDLQLNDSSTENVTSEETTTTEQAMKLDESIITYDIPLEKLVIEAEIQYNNIQVEEVYLDENFKYATYSQINTGFAKLYKNNSYNKKEGVICVNAGHGVKGGEKYSSTSTSFK